jgi:hypothetical protein
MDPVHASPSAVLDAHTTCAICLQYLVVFFAREAKVLCKRGCGLSGSQHPGLTALISAGSGLIHAFLVLPAKKISRFFFTKSLLCGNM